MPSLLLLLYLFLSLAFAFPTQKNNGSVGIYERMLLDPLLSNCSFPPRDVPLISTSCDRKLPSKDNSGILYSEFDPMMFLCSGVYSVAVHVCKVLNDHSTEVQIYIPKTYKEMLDLTSKLGKEFCSNARTLNWDIYEESHGEFQVIKSYFQNRTLCERICVPGEIHPLCETIFWGSTLLNEMKTKRTPGINKDTDQHPVDSKRNNVSQTVDASEKDVDANVQAPPSAADVDKAPSGPGKDAIPPSSKSGNYPLPIERLSSANAPNYPDYTGRESGPVGEQDHGFEHSEPVGQFATNPAQQPDGGYDAYRIQQLRTGLMSDKDDRQMPLFAGHVPMHSSANKNTASGQEAPPIQASDKKKLYTTIENSTVQGPNDLKINATSSKVQSEQQTPPNKKENLSPGNDKDAQSPSVQIKVPEETVPEKTDDSKIEKANTVKSDAGGEAEPPIFNTKMSEADVTVENDEDNEEPGQLNEPEKSDAAISEVQKEAKPSTSSTSVLDNDSSPLLSSDMQFESGKDDANFIFAGMGDDEESKAVPGISSGNFVGAEDSHFFAYFLTVVVSCIVGYLVFHNKQKILALVIEGRGARGTRRRPNTAAYRKLDSNLEEAITSSRGTSVTHVIY